MAKNKRISLRSLQPSAIVGSNELVGQTSLINSVKGTKKSVKASSNLSNSQKSISQFCAKKTDKNKNAKGFVDKENRTEDSMEKDLCSENVSENYWKEFAEQRREALVETLEENKKLYEENMQLKNEKKELLVENEELKAENERLQLYVSKAEEISKILESLTEEESNEETSS